MPIHQNSSVDTTKLILGNYKIEVALTTVESSYINLGAGMVNSFGHNITKYAVQAGNAPDPIEGVATETFTVAADLIEYDASSLNIIQAGSISNTAGTSGQTIIKGGGNSILTPKIFRLTNRRLISGVTDETIILVYNATLDTGLQFTAKSDNDADPINVMPIAITAKPDSTLSAGAQLFTVTHTYNP